MKETKRNILGQVMAGKYTDVDTLLDKVNNLIQTGEITVSNDPILPSPMDCLQWGLTYKIYDCLYEHESLTPVEIDSLINDSLYCHRKFRPLSKPRLCYNTNLLERSIRW